MIARIKRKKGDKEDADIATAAAAAAALSPPPPPSPPKTITVNTPTDSSVLPEISIPEFNGNFRMWSAFWDVFEVEVKEKTKYSSAIKFNFLNS